MKKSEALSLLLSLVITLLLLIGGVVWLLSSDLNPFASPDQPPPSSVGRSTRTTPIISMVVTPDARTIATGNYGSNITLWDVETRSPSRLEQHQGRVNSLAIVGDRLVSGSGDGSIRVWDITNAYEIQEPLSAAARVLSLAAANDGTVAAGYSDGYIRIWNIVDGSLVQAIAAHDDQVSSLAFSPADPDVLVSGSHDGTIKVWDWTIDSSQLVHRMDAGSKVTSLDIRGNDGRIASGDYDGRIRFWNLDTGEEMNSAILGHTFIVGDVDFSPDGETLLSAGYDEKVRLWTIRTGQAQQTFDLSNEKAGFVFAAEFVNPDGPQPQIAIASYDGRVRLWNLNTEEAIAF